MAEWALKTIDEETFHTLCWALDSALHLRKLPDGHMTWDCDHTLKKTSRWLEHHTTLGITDVLQEFRSLGGFCDCEVMLNVMPAVTERESDSK